WIAQPSRRQASIIRTGSPRRPRYRRALTRSWPRRFPGACKPRAIPNAVCSASIRLGSAITKARPKTWPAWRCAGSIDFQANADSISPFLRRGICFFESPTRASVLRIGARFAFEQTLLARDAPTPSARRSIGAHHAMARHDEGELVAAAGVADSSRLEREIHVYRVVGENDAVLGTAYHACLDQCGNVGMDRAYVAIDTPRHFTDGQRARA